MPIANDLRKTLTDPTPLYFAAGVVDKIREEAPQALAAVRETDPKEVQAKLTQQAKETQAKVSETLSGIDTDIKKLREQAQHLALQGVGVAAEYAVKARETYEELSVRGREAVRNWRGESGDEAPEVTVEREPAQSVKIAEPPAEESPEADTGAGAGTAAKTDKTAKTVKPDDTSAKSAGGNGTKAGAAKKTSTSARKSTGSTGSTTSSTRKSAPKNES
ncbi:hypothetical protein ITI46_05580 [Streptomyces oryzae]|uniref:Heparin binding hemagglutinin HbhA n=1 Tax=Streptomyces oryzae TaxID=1434886 RepID=A0ABS3X750_9ACTN|nr:hypothetical protein [Streptomyces oryzae]MBO8191163.1 hypothetical protein [Streptomyces oryzae]